jgi:hypothetical protein
MEITKRDRGMYSKNTVHGEMTGFLKTVRNV